MRAWGVPFWFFQTKVRPIRASGWVPARRGLPGFDVRSGHWQSFGLGEPELVCFCLNSRYVCSLLIERMVTDDCGVGKGLESVVLNCDLCGSGDGQDWWRVGMEVFRIEGYPDGWCQAKHRQRKSGT